MDQCFLTASFILWFWVPFAILLRSWLIFQPSSENMKSQHIDDAVIRSSNWVRRRRRSWGQWSGWPYLVAFADLLVKKKIMEAGAPSENIKGHHVDDFLVWTGSTYLTRDPITWPGRWSGRVSKLWMNVLAFIMPDFSRLSGLRFKLFSNFSLHHIHQSFSSVW